MTDCKFFIVTTTSSADYSNNTIEHKIKKISNEVMGDVVNASEICKDMHEQMKNELATLNIQLKISPIHENNIVEVNTPVLTSSEATEQRKFNFSPEICGAKQASMSSRNKTEIINTVKKDMLQEDLSDNVTVRVLNDGSKCQVQTKSLNKEKDVKLAIFPITHICASTPDVSTVILKESKDLVTMNNPINDAPSSDISDTDTEKPDIISNESCVDENSRDERDEVSEVENFDLSSCGEDSLEAMYYMLRKNEIIMDKDKPKKIKIEDDKISFPEMATENLENVFREVSGKQIFCSIHSAKSSTDEVISKHLSSDSDALQLNVLPFSEIDSSTKHKPYALNITDDQYLIESNEVLLCEITADESHYNDKHHISKTNYGHLNDSKILADDVVQACIERKIQAFSLSEADSEEVEISTSNYLNKDDFNVSTVLRSTTEDSGSFESAVTKIQAYVRAFLTRKQIKTFGAEASISIEKTCSIQTTDESLEQSIDRKIENFENDNVREFFEVTVEQKREDARNDFSAMSTHDAAYDEITSDNKNTRSDNDSGAVQRRSTLQRGDAIQRNSTLDSEQRKDENLKESTRDMSIQFEKGKHFEDINMKGKPNLEALLTKGKFKFSYFKKYCFEASL